MAQNAVPPGQSALRNRGTPTGRVGAATREKADQVSPRSLELVAPQAGVGLTSSDQPVLFYLLSDPTSRPLHLIISVPNRPRPLVDITLARFEIRDGIGMVRLRDHGVRLVPDTTCTWSVGMQVDPAAPSHDIVASALIRYVPMKQALVTELNRADRLRRYSFLTDAEYWYDAAALADESRASDGGAAFRDVLHVLGLIPVNHAG